MRRRRRKYRGLIDQLDLRPLKAFPHVWTRKALPANRKGQPCKIVAKGATADTCKIEFRDGRKFVVARAGLAKREDT